MKWYEKLLRWGFCSNYWIWFHILAAGIFAKIINIWLCNLSTIFLIFVGAVSWEVIEYIKDGDQIINIYGSIERWIYDCFGDIIGAVVCAVIVVI